MWPSHAEDSLLQSYIVIASRLMVLLLVCVYVLCSDSDA